MGGLPSLNRVFKPVLNLACYIRYNLPLVLKPELPRLGLIKGVQKPFWVMSFVAEILCDLWLQIFIRGRRQGVHQAVIENISSVLDVF